MLSITSSSSAFSSGPLSKKSANDCQRHYGPFRKSSEGNSFNVDRSTLHVHVLRSDFPIVVRATTTQEDEQRVRICRTKTEYF